VIKETLYYQYIKERQGAEVIEDEQGFIVYRINGDECFIVDMNVAPAFRGSSRAGELIRELSEIAVLNGCKFLAGNVHICFENHPQVLAASFKQGFKIIAASGDVLTIAKKVGG
jgi:hypothetical protein